MAKRDNAGPDHHDGIGLAGRLLVSLPQLDEGPFAQSIVLICEHDEEHAFGVIVNKPVAGLMAVDAVAELPMASDAAASPAGAPVYFGGPCEPQRGFVLHTSAYESEGTVEIPGGFGLTGTRDALEHLYGDRLTPDTARLVAGHAGWSAGQLDDELRRHCWLDLPADPELVFGTPDDEMWNRAIDALGLDATQLTALSVDHRAGSRPLN